MALKLYKDKKEEKLKEKEEIENKIESEIEKKDSNQSISYIPDYVYENNGDFEFVESYYYNKEQSIKGKILLIGLAIIVIFLVLYTLFPETITNYWYKCDILPDL